jgi:hypothetical protein
MSFRALVLRRSYAVVFFLGLIAAPAALGQLPTSPIKFVNQEAITTSFVTAPNVNTDTNASSPSSPGQWLKVEFHYGITPAVGNFQDAVEFKVWIEGLDLLAKNAPVPGKGAAVVLTGSVTYINIPAGKDCYGVFYVHPSTLARYSTDRGYEDFDRKFNVHIEASVGGAVMDYFDKMKDKAGLDWYKAPTAIPGLVYRQDQCPFLISNPDRYPMIKLPAPAQ